MVGRTVFAVFAGAIILGWFAATVIAVVLSAAFKGIRKLIKLIRSATS